MDNDIRLTKSFQIKKWLLFSFCAFSMLVTIIMAALASTLVNKIVDDETYDSNVNKESVKTAAKTIIWVISVIVILFDLVGLMGAFKEHFCMTVTYAVLVTISFLSSIGMASKNSYYWFNTVLYLIVCCLAYAFAWDLRQRRQQLFARHVVVGVPQQQVIHVSSNYAPQQYAPQQYAGGQQYSGQSYGTSYSGGQVPPQPQEFKGNYP